MLVMAGKFSFLQSYAIKGVNIFPVELHNKKQQKKLHFGHSVPLFNNDAAVSFA